MTVEEWLGNDELRTRIWYKKYQRNNETFDAWLDRVSGGDQEVRQLIVEKKFLFGGRILSNRGISAEEEKSTLSNCYVIEPPEDNIESIYKTCGRLARTFSYGGGCGIDISNLSPKGAKVRNQAKTTSGAVSFMSTFAQVPKQIGQNGRRGALMISMDVSHPDILDFIDAKKNCDEITSANISVRVSDDFMRAVDEDAYWTMKYIRKETGEVIENTLKARKIFDKLCENNWAYAEPGILFWDRIKNWNMQSNNPKFSYAGVNPCISGNSLVMTTDGEIPISQLVGTQPDVYCMDKNGDICIRRATKVWKTRKNAEVVCVETQRGSLICTPDHMIHTRTRGWIPASQLTHGDRITGLNRQMKDEIHVAVGLSGGKYVPEHRLVAGYYYDIIGNDVHHIDGNTFNNTIDNLEVMPHSEHSKISNTGRKIESIRDSKGRYLAKEVKAKRYSVNQECGVGTNWFVTDVYYLDGHEDVYDMTVPDVHNFIANRMVVHNCAEEPLPSSGSCNLGALNLAAFVDEDGLFDVYEFGRAVKVCIYALNRVLDEGRDKHPLIEQRKCVTEWNQVGLGIMGLGDCLIKQGIRYGSDEACNFSDYIGTYFAQYAILASEELAFDKNKSYIRFNKKQINSNKFVKQHLPSDGSHVIEKLANSQLLTIAPTGSISTMLGVSGGIEPIFAKSYIRKTESLNGETTYYDVVTPIFSEYMEKHGITDVNDLPDWFVTSADIPVEERIQMQAAWQNHIDASISSTINLPESATVEDIKNLYMKAWKAGLKGVTVYRANCSRAGVLVDKEKKSDKTTTDKSETSSEVSNAVVFDSIIPVSRKTLGTTHGRTYCKKCACGTLYITLNRDDEGHIVESFINTSKGGVCQANISAVNRLVSLSLRSGVKVDEIIDQIHGINCKACTQVKLNGTELDGLSCPDILARTLKEFILTDDMVISNSKSQENPNEDASSTEEVCPECGSPLVHTGGCVECTNCPWSRCG